MQTNYLSFDEIPEDLKKRVGEVSHPDEATWVNKAIPALEGRTFLEQLNQENGYVEVCKYLTKIEGYLR